MEEKAFRHLWSEWSISVLWKEILNWNVNLQLKPFVSNRILKQKLFCKGNSKLKLFWRHTRFLNSKDFPRKTISGNHLATSTFLIEWCQSYKCSKWLSCCLLAWVCIRDTAGFELPSHLPLARDQWSCLPPWAEGYRRCTCICFLAVFCQMYTCLGWLRNLLHIF